MDTNRLYKLTAQLILSCVVIFQMCSVRAEVKVEDWTVIPNTTPDNLSEFYEKVDRSIAGRLELGTRLTSFTLSESARSTNNTYLGNINELKIDNNLKPTKLFLKWNFNPNFGLEITWDELNVDTMNFNNHLGDGSIEVVGPIVSFYGRFTNDSIVTPYFGVGLYMPKADFNHDEWWHLGYESPEHWESAGGKSADNYLGTTREIKLSSDNNITMYIGCDIKLNKNIFVDLFWRYIDIDVEAEYEYTNGRTQILSEDDGTFVLDHYAWGLGLKYVF